MILKKNVKIMLMSKNRILVDIYFEGYAIGGEKTVNVFSTINYYYTNFRKYIYAIFFKLRSISKYETSIKSDIFLHFFSLF